ALPPAVDSRHRTHALGSLSSACCADRRDSVAVPLDGGDPWPSSATQLRTRLLLSLFGADMLFRLQPTRAERGTLLRHPAAGLASVRVDFSVPRTLVYSPARCARTRRIRFATRIAR